MTLANAYRSGALTPTALVEKLLVERRKHAAHNIWISVVTDEALRARARELADIDPKSLPLYGIPFAIKDNIDFAGLPTTAGCAAFAYQPAESNPVVQALIDAGAIALGKTNLDQFATGLVGTRSPYGICTQRVRSRLHQRRFLERVRGGRGARARQFLAGHRHRRLGPRARRIQ